MPSEQNKWASIFHSNTRDVALKTELVENHFGSHEVQLFLSSKSYKPFLNAWNCVLSKYGSSSNDSFSSWEVRSKSKRNVSELACN